MIEHLLCRYSAAAVSAQTLIAHAVKIAASVFLKALSLILGLTYAQAR